MKNDNPTIKKIIIMILQNKVILNNLKKMVKKFVNIHNEGRHKLFKLKM